MQAAVCAGTFLHHLEIESRDPERLAAFYAKALQMEHVRSGERHLCRGPDRLTLFKAGRDKTLGFAAFACRDADALAALRQHIESRGVELLPSPSPLFDERAFAVRDPEGNTLVFGLGNGEIALRPPGVLRGPLQHVTVNSTQMAAMEAFYTDRLGFALSDRVRDDTGRVTTFFVRGNHEHHTVGFFLKDKAGLDHHSYEAGEWDTIRDWADHLAAMRIPIVWGPGRHGPGNNLFVFIEDPDKNMIEISAEIETIRDRPVKEWKHEPYTLNLWGRAIMRV
jgi:catechol 2,3-dioxygenase-like lactoylglutathione lyase family enzyme